MAPLFVFLIKCNLVILGTYLIYRLFLSGKKQYGFNRAILLLIYVATPAVVYFAEMPATEVQALPIEVPVAPALANEAIGPAADFSPVDTLWPSILLEVWKWGVAAFALMFIVNVWRTLKVIRCSRVFRARNVRVAVAKNATLSPFSFLNTIVVTDCEKHHIHYIVRHELEHIRLWHWADLTVANAVCILSWFNPAAWLLLMELKETHEFQVDRRVLDSGINRRDYQYMLLDHAVSDSVWKPVNNFKQGGIKRRIQMMACTDDNAFGRFQALLLLPTSIFAIWIINSRPAADFLTNFRALDIEEVDRSIAASPSAAEHALPAQEIAEEAAPVPAAEPTYGAEIDELVVVAPRVAPTESSAAAEALDTEKASPVVEVKVSLATTDIPASIMASVGNEYSSPFYYINGKSFHRLPKGFDESKIESVVVRRDNPYYPNGVYYITLKSE